MGFDKFNTFSQPIFFTLLFFFYFSLLPFSWLGFVPKQSVSVLKQRRWIRRGSVTAYETWQVIPNYWKLANCWSISSQPDMFYTRTNTKWTRLLERFVSSCASVRTCVHVHTKGCDFNVWLNSPNVLFCFFLSPFFTFFSTASVISHPNDTLCSPCEISDTHKHTHTDFFWAPAACCTFTLRQTHTHTQSSGRHIRHTSYWC